MKGNLPDWEKGSLHPGLLWRAYYWYVRVLPDLSRAVDELAQPGNGNLPDWVGGLAAAVEADRTRPRSQGPVRPDWLEDVRAAEQAVRRPARRKGPSGC